ncbi:MAG: alginate export family protein [Verrucomicrobiota bacterium]
MTLSSVTGEDAIAILETSAWEPGDPMRIADERMTFDLSIRERLIFLNNWVDFNDSFDLRDDLALQHRLRFGIRTQITDEIAIYGQFQDSRTFFDEPAGPVFNREFINQDDPTELYQAFFEWKASPHLPIDFQIGRQEWNWGDGRLLASNEWTNNGRVFDGVTMSFNQTDYKLSGFAGWPVIAESDTINSPDTEDLITGMYLEGNWSEKIDIEPYLIFRSKSDRDVRTTLTNADNQNAGNLAPPGDYITLGTHIESKPGAYGPVDFRFEVAVQAGEISDPIGLGNNVGGQPINTGRQDFLAGAVHSQVGYTFEDSVGALRIFFEFNYASGDDDPNDNESHTFQPLFPEEHRFHGIQDRYAWMNMVEFVLGTEWQPVSRWQIALSGHWFWIPETNDVRRNSAQSALGGAARYAAALANNPGNFAAFEIDLVTRYRLTRWASLEAGYSHFFAGDYYRGSSPSLGGVVANDDIDFAYLQLSLNF